MLLKINNNVYDRIRIFYDNAMRKYPNTYFPADADRDTDRVMEEVYKVTTNELWHKNDIKSVRGWENYLVDYSKETGWYFAYKIENDIIYIEDAENHRNMSEEAFKF
ncbi:hypothetical protein FACS189434_05960 [Bacteroidia bacterium]|nr:hypothetical protein FACS189434_05960 [Bacteroidia bacterium]